MFTPISSGRLAKYSLLTRPCDSACSAKIFDCHDINLMKYLVALCYVALTQHRIREPAKQSSNVEVQPHPPLWLCNEPHPPYC